MLGTDLTDKKSSNVNDCGKPAQNEQRITKFHFSQIFFLGRRVQQLFGSMEVRAFSCSGRRNKYAVPRVTITEGLIDFKST